MDIYAKNDFAIWMIIKERLFRECFNFLVLYIKYKVGTFLVAYHAIKCVKSR